jgi:multisubunit Na+/H+ antiporter MnhC subunit
LCIAASVVACILAIWDFTKKDALWRLVASFAVIGTGTALFTYVNGRFGDDRPS